MLYLGVKGERRAPSELIKAGGAELQAQWMVDEQEMERWAGEESVYARAGQA